MDTAKNATLTTELGRKIRSLSLDKGNLRHVLQILQERSLAAGDIEASRYQKNNQTDAEFEANKRTIKNGFIFYITLKGTDGRQLNGSIDAIFDSPNFPDAVESVFFDSASPLKLGHNYYAANSLILFLDFTRPDIFNFSMMPSQETPNSSNIMVRGNDSTWVNGVFHEFEKLTAEYPSTVTWLHRHSTYDILLWLIGFPLGFSMCFRASKFLATINSDFLRAAAYVYVFLLSLLGFRILFHYARWIWPLVEFRGKNRGALKHRVFWMTVILGVVANFAYDILKLLR